MFFVSIKKFNIEFCNNLSPEGFRHKTVCWPALLAFPGKQSLTVISLSDCFVFFSSFLCFFREFEGFWVFFFYILLLLLLCNSTNRNQFVFSFPFIYCCHIPFMHSFTTQRCIFEELHQLPFKRVRKECPGIHQVIVSLFFQIHMKRSTRRTNVNTLEERKFFRLLGVHEKTHVSATVFHIICCIERLVQNT